MSRFAGVTHPAGALVLSIFPGLGLLDRAFELEGFTVVRGPDPLWGGDIRTWNPPPGYFDGIIGGDPCQSHSTLANLVRAKGLEPTFPDLTGEYTRIVELVQPKWFVRENVPRAPAALPKGYDVSTFILKNQWLGEAQKRTRRFWFGMPGTLGPVANLRKWIPGAALELPDCVQAVCGDPRAVAVAVGGSGKVKRTAATGGHAGHAGHADERYGMPARYTLAEMLDLQGLPHDFCQHSPFTAQALRKMLGNGVPIAMGRAVANAVHEALR